MNYIDNCIKILEDEGILYFENNENMNSRVSSKELFNKLENEVSFEILSGGKYFEDNDIVDTYYIYNCEYFDPESALNFIIEKVESKQ